MRVTLLSLPLLLAVGCGCYASVMLANLEAEVLSDGTIKASFDILNNGLCFDWPEEDVICTTVTWFRPADSADTGQPADDSYRDGRDELLDELTECFGQAIPEGDLVERSATTAAAIDIPAGVRVQAILHGEDIAPGDEGWDYGLGASNLVVLP